MPVVLAVRLLVLVNIFAPLVPIAPLPEVNDSVPAVSKPEPEIVPVPVAVRVAELPVRAPFTNMLEFVPLFVNEILPLETNPLAPTMIPVPDDAVSVNVNEAELCVDEEIDTTLDSVI